MFKKMMIFNYYDGELSGIYAEDEACQTISRFDLLSWDDEQEWRIFCIGQIPNGNVLFRKLVEFYAQFDKEHWPVWAPSVVPAGKKNEELELRRALDSKRQYQSVVLSTQFHKDVAKITPIKGDLEMLVQDFIRTGELQDFKTCKRLLDRVSGT
jgi:hypothetical protein